MRWSFAPVVIILLSIAMPVGAQTSRPEVWFNPHGPARDLLDMWTDNAPWQQAASKVQVLVLVHWWIRQATDAQLIQIRDFAQRHHMKIDISTEPIAKSLAPACGQEEGYMTVKEMTATVDKLVRLKFIVDWLDMDGPLMAGHYDTGANGCHLSIPDLVKQVALTLNYMVAAWPDIHVMEIEPLVAVTSMPTWRQDETAFHIGLAAAIGRPVEAMQSDVEWLRPTWKQAMLDVRKYAKQQNLAYSVIYNASSAPASDAEWIASTISNFEAVEGELRIVPDKVLFTSWAPYRLYNMPETSPTAQTWLINRYVRPPSLLQAQFVGTGVHGKLTDEQGKPIPNATINGYKPGVDFTKPLPITVVQGVVPATAVRALIGVRLNTECGCNGMNDVLFGTFTYQETQGGALTGAYTFPVTSANWGGVSIGTEMVGGTKVSRVIAAPGLPYLTNSANFLVTANAQYQFNIPAATIAGLGWFGNVVLIFADAQGNRTRVTTVPAADRALMATTVTNQDGTFSMRKMPRSVDGPNPVTVEFDGGGGTYRSSVWKPIS